MSDRAATIETFLRGTRWQSWTLTPLAGDASTRRYFRLSHENRTVILMDAPPVDDEDTQPFAKLAHFLNNAGFSAPEILAHDAAAGLMLLSDLGRTDFVQWLAKHPSDESQLYKAAADILLKLETITPPKNLTKMTPAVGANMVKIIGVHYTQSPVNDLCAEMENALTAFAPDPTTLALRDYHAENLIWRPGHDGSAGVGLLDFQDAFIAPAGYDLASLIRDARRDVSKSVADETINYFAAQTKAGSQFRIGLACLSVQRNLRILGVFARLATVLNKPRYLAFMPRVWEHILQDLEAQELKYLRHAVLDTVPAPSSSNLKDIAK